jgi:hypothetical protein
MTKKIFFNFKAVLYAYNVLHILFFDIVMHYKQDWQNKKNPHLTNVRKVHNKFNSHLSI